MKFFGLFEVSRRKKKKDEAFLNSSDIENIDEILYQKEKHLKEIDYLDRKIILIQKSTKTVVPQFQPLHDRLRQKYRWYYDWHVWPYSRIADFLILCVYLFALTLFSANYLSTPKTVYAATYDCMFDPGSGPGADVWSNASKWDTCNGQYPGQGADTYNVSIPSPVTLDLANVNLHGGNVTMDMGELYIGANSLTTNDFYIGSGDVVTIGSGTLNANGWTTISGGTLTGSSGTINFGGGGFGGLIVNNAGSHFTASSVVNFYDSDSTVPYQHTAGIVDWTGSSLNFNISSFGSPIILPNDTYNNFLLNGDTSYDFAGGPVTISGNFTNKTYFSPTVDLNVNGNFTNDVEVSMGGFLNVQGNFVNNSTFYANSYGMAYGGNWTNNTAGYSSGAAPTFFNGTTVFSNTGTTYFETLYVTGTVTLGSDLTIDNIEGTGVFNLGANHNLTVGDLDIDRFNGGTGTSTLIIGNSPFNPGSPSKKSYNNITITDNGYPITINGNNLAANNLTINRSSVTFETNVSVSGTLSCHTANAQFNIKNGSNLSAGNLDITGNQGSLIKFRSTSAGNSYNVSASNIASFDYLDLQDAHNTGDIITVSHGRDSGGNSRFYLTNNYELSASTKKEKSMTGWEEQVTAKDFYGNTVISDSFTTVEVTSSSENVAFYTDDKYKTETGSYILSGGGAAIYLKASNKSDESITYTIIDSRGKTATSGSVFITGSSLLTTLENLPEVIVNQMTPTEEEKKTIEKVAETLTDALSPISKAIALVGLIPLILQILQAIPSAAPLASSVFPVLFTTASVRRRKKPWGNVFDSLTGHAVDLAVVRLYEKETDKLISTQVTDFDGRFHFLASIGTYYIKVEKKGYNFPVKISKFKASQLFSRFGKDSDIYLGVPFVIQGKNAQINLNIPLDPIIEKMTNGIKFRKTFKESFDWFLIGISYVAIPLMLVGAAIAALSTIVKPTNINFITDGAYLALLSGFLVTSRIQKNRMGQVFDSVTKEPIASAMVTVFDSEYNAIRQTQTTDKNGNFAILAQKGAYYIVIEKEGYKFPSTNLTSTKKRPFYTGGTINKEKSGFIGVDVPVDRK